MPHSNKFLGYLQDFACLIFPEYCAACGCALFRNEKVLCLKCYTGLPRTGFHHDPENEVARMFWGRVQVSNVTSFMYFAKGSPYQHILHGLKYTGQKEIGTEMGHMFGNELKGSPFSQADMIHPVPLHPSKLRKRGYNQSELIARGMADVLHIPVETRLISRTVDTLTQTDKSRYERWENVKHIFRCEDPDKIRDKHVLLVDDVITTGATLEAVASCILAVKGVTVSIASLAFAKLQ
jgi:ComF family protein